MGKKAVITAGSLGGLSVIVAIAGFVSVRTLCACMTVAQNFGSAVGAWPYSADAFRAKLLEIIPPGTTIDDMQYSLAQMARGSRVERGDKPGSDWYKESMNRRCTVAPGAMTCRFVEIEEWWALKKTGFDVHATLDGLNRLVDLRIARFSEWAL